MKADREEEGQVPFEVASSEFSFLPPFLPLLSPIDPCITSAHTIEREEEAPLTCYDPQSS